MFLTRGCPRSAGPLVADDDIYRAGAPNLTDLTCLACGHDLTWPERVALTTRHRCRGRARPAPLILVSLYAA
jgi:hypothetical protein